MQPRTYAAFSFVDFIMRQLLSNSVVAIFKNKLMSLKVGLIDMVRPDCIGGRGGGKGRPLLPYARSTALRALDMSAADHRTCGGSFST